jgi:hypothetical protein
MLQGLTGPLNPEQHKQMTMVQNSSRHLLSLINDVLDISKIEAGQLELVAKPFHLGESLEKSVKMLTTLADAKGLQLSLDIADNIGMLIADQRRVEQVVINLVNNAVKFTERGSVTVCCSLDGPDMLIRIRDSGVGIRESDLERLFTPFYQVDSGLTRRYEGTGLGLSICKRLLGLMGGSITVSSEWGKGSEFTVRLPAKLEETDG